jgi:hypothetical protein
MMKIEDGKIGIPKYMTPSQMLLGKGVMKLPSM